MVNALVLKEFRLLRGLDDRELAEVAELCKEYPLYEGEGIFAEGTRATYIHLCTRGTVEFVIWVRDPWNKNVMVHKAHAGEAFGWSALVPPYEHTGSTTCVEDGEEIRIKGSELLEMFDQNPHMGFLVMRNLTVDMRAWLTETRKTLSIEWLAGGMALAVGSSAWGEAGRR